MSNGKVNLSGFLDITHTTVSTSERIKYDINDADGAHLLSLNDVNNLAVLETTVDVYNNLYVQGDISYTGSIGQTSDERLKENINNISTKSCLSMVKNIDPIEFNYIKDEKKTKRIGYSTQQWHKTDMPDDWDITFNDSEGYYKIDYSKSSVALFGAVKELAKEITHLKSEITKLKNEVKGKGKVEGK